MDSHGSRSRSGPRMLCTIAMGFILSGCIDRDFGDYLFHEGDGLVTYPRVAAQGADLQPDGKILLVGWWAEEQVMALGRLHPDGSPDLAFGDQLSGWSFFEPDFQHGILRNVFYQPDGKILAVGAAGGLAIVRYTQDGHPDRSFSGDGFHQYPIVQDMYDAAQHDNGKLVVSGSNYLARFLPDGRPDPSFGFQGFVFLGRYERIPSIDIQQDGKVLATGRFTGTLSGIVTRHLLDGSLDPSFGTGGILEIDPNLFGSASPEKVVAAPDGSILVASGWRIWRYDSAGRIIEDFGDGGLASLNLQAGAGGIVDMVVDAQGRILALMEGYDGALHGVRLNPDGSLEIVDTPWGLVPSVRSVEIGGDFVMASDLLLDNRGGILGVGTDFENTNLARFHP